MATLSRLHIVYFTAVGVFALWVGVFGTFAPQEIASALPWSVPTLHARVIGAMYLSGAVVMLGSLFAGRRRDVAVGLTMAVTWTGVLMVVTLLHLDRFDFTRMPVWFWFFAYAVFPAAGAWLLGMGGRHGDDGAARPPVWLRGALVVQGTAALGLAVALFVTPRTMAAVWPWQIPLLITEIYSAPMAAIGVASLMMARRPWDAIRLPAVAMLAFFCLLALASMIHADLFSPGPATLVWAAAIGAAALLAATLLVVGALAEDEAVAVAARETETPVAWWLRLWLVVEIGFGIAAVASIAWDPADSARNFAWTISPTVTAAVLGAFYISAAALFFGAVFGASWERIRVIMLPAALFTATELAATLLHWDRFSVGSAPFAVWFASYLLPPPVFALAIWVHGRRARRVAVTLRPGRTDPAAPLPGWVRWSLLALGTVLAVDGVLSFVFPELMMSTAPWRLTPLTTRALCGWLIAFGTMMLAVARENHIGRARVAGPFFLVLLPAMALQVSRFAGDIDWSHPRVPINIAVMVIIAVIGARLTFGGAARPARSFVRLDLDPPTQFA